MQVNSKIKSSFKWVLLYITTIVFFDQLEIDRGLELSGSLQIIQFDENLTIICKLAWKFNYNWFFFYFNLSYDLLTAVLLLQK